MSGKEMVFLLKLANLGRAERAPCIGLGLFLDKRRA